jgi:hypothetical protein
MKRLLVIIFMIVLCGCVKRVHTKTNMEPSGIDTSDIYCCHQGGSGGITGFIIICGRSNALAPECGCMTPNHYH